jgi:hypothetical protein
MSLSFGDGIPVLGKWSSDTRAANDFNSLRGLVDSRLSIKTQNGVTPASSNQETTIALGAAQVGAALWMQAGGDKEKYKTLRDQYMREANILQGAAAISLNTNGMSYMQAMKKNFDRGAAVAQGLKLNSLTEANMQTASRGIVTKAKDGYFFNGKNEQLAVHPNLQAVGYQQAQQQQQNRNQGQRR